MAFSIKAAIAEIEQGEKTFVSFLAKEYQAFYKSEPTLIQTVDSTVSYVQDALTIVLSVEGAGAAVPAVNAIINEAVSDLNRASALVYDFGPSPTAQSIFTTVQANLATIESVGNITDAATKAKIQLIYNAVGTVASLLAKAVAAAKTPTSA